MFLTPVAKKIFKKRKINIKKNILFFVLFLLFITVSKKIYSQTNPYPWSPDFNKSEAFNNAMQDSSGLNSYKWVREVLDTLLFTAENAASGGLTNGPRTQLPLTINDMTPPGGLVSYPVQAMSFMYTTSPTGDFTQYLASLGVFKQVYSASPGTNALRITLHIWLLARNICYIFSIIFLLVIGVMIMFRTKIDPRTVMTVTNSLPKIVMALLIITFSYAIAGFMFDLVSVSNTLVSNVLQRTLFTDISGVAKFYCPAFAPNDTVARFPCALNSLDVFRVFGVGFSLSKIFDGALTLKVGTGLPWPLGSIEMGSMLSLAISFALFSAALKLTFSLLSAYARFFVNTLLGPFIALFSVLPTKVNPITKWFKGFLSSILSFTLVYLVLNIAYYIYLYSFAPGSGVSSIMAPLPLPFSLVSTGATSSAGTQQSMAFLLVFAIVLMTPSIPGIVDEMMDTSPSRAAGSAGADITQAAKKIPIVGGLF